MATFIAELIVGLFSWLFDKSYRAKHPELLGRPAEELALTFAKIQLIHAPVGLRIIFLSPLLPIIVILVGVLLKADILVVALIAVGVWFLEILWLGLIALPIFKFAATVEPNKIAMQDYFLENKAAVISLALKDPKVISAHKKISAFYVKRAIKNVRTDLYHRY
jgi:hypothetical protein